MAYKIFIDANILLDFTLKRPDYTTARNIIEFTVNKKINAFISPSIVQICGYWLSKSYGKEQAKNLLNELLTIIHCIDLPHEQVLTALHSSMDDIEDALQYYTALYHKLDYLISRDRHFQKSAIPALPVVSPEDFLMLIQ